MRRARRFPQRIVRWTSLCVCLALIATSLAIAPGSFLEPAASAQNDQSNAKARKVKPASPEKGATSSVLPNLDEAKRQRQPDPEAKPAIPSTIRSRRKPLEDRRGKKVGDPGTRLGASNTGTAGISSTVASRSRSNRIKGGRDASDKLVKLNHVRARTRTAAAPPFVPDNQFIQDFIYWAFQRTHNSAELTYWTDILRSAHPQGQSLKLLAARELGRTIFESAEYAARGRDNHWYVYDLYKTYLMRDPDGPGWAFWESVCNAYGRAAVRAAFDESIEFNDLVAAMTPNGSITNAVSSIGGARVDPFNQTGDQLRARDCEWSVGLLSLPGRAGLDLGLGVSYSSLVWTRSGPSAPYVYFDEDSSSISPGFRLGFASIQGPYFDAQVGRKVYVLVSSSGGRVELRQVGTSNVYEAADSSYLQLTDNGSSLLLRPTDGMQMSYSSFANGWQATQIKDRNGNYLTVNNDWRGDIVSITDTLGRVINFNNDGNGNLISITQSWNGSTHTWATFGWGTVSMQPSFSGVSVTGTYNGEVIPVLTQVGLHDGSYFTFQYTAAAQVNLIRRYTSDNVQRSYTAYDYAAAGSDCPRISQTRVWAENWTGINGVPYEVATQFSEPGDGSHQMVAPDGTVYKEFYGTSWQKGLATLSETWSGGVRQKWTTIALTQDNTGVNYQVNPRVTETNIYDSSGNRRRTVIDYQGSFGLPWIVADFAADGVSVIRRTYFDYNNDSTYLNRRIIGLLFRHSVYDGSWNLTAKTEYYYDWSGDHLQSLPQAPVQHDGTNYPASFIAGRGNLCDVIRFDASDPNNWSKVTEFKSGYNVAGSLAFTRDHLWHQNFTSYTDSFSDSVNRNTFAYPTTLTDADGYQSLVKYNYDFGAKTRVQTPTPAGQSQGAIQTFAYDSAARIQQVTTTNNGAYRRYLYGPNYVVSLASINYVGDEAYSNTVLDGAGRVTGVATNHPGSSGGYKARLTQYDLMGRSMKQSNATEISGSWVPYGDDASGMVYTQQTYDWKGRPLVTTNTDGTQKYASYGGCGCAGGEVVTITDEVGRQQKVYSDVLGRTAKSEVLNWNGTVYSTTANTYNVRDQVTLVRQYQGAEGSGVYQDTTMTYDGHGRLQSKHVPDQNAGTATIYSYNSDDTINTVTDARGSFATYSYNSRHLVTGIVYTPSSGVAATPSVSYGYDAAGNRTSMTDGLGSKSYTYNQLSQLMSETRTFTGVGTFTLGYDYNLAGQLKKITDSTNMTINYGYDVAGRLNGVTGSDNLYASVSNYASDFGYRAWGGLKAMTDGTNHISSLLYNSKLQPSQFAISGNVVNQNYDYYNDGRISYVHNTTDVNFDRAYSYDHAGRITGATTGGIARGDSGSTPYHETFGYDALSNLTSRYTLSWGQDEFSDGAPYTNNRREGWGYDADGRNTTIDTRTYTFDAAGQTTLMTGQKWLINHYVNVSQSAGYDGDGVKVKEVLSGVATYYLKSSVMRGAIIEELSSSGAKNVGYVYAAGGRLLARQSNNQVTWTHTTPAGTSKYDLYTGGTAGRVEFDPLGADVGIDSPQAPDTGGGQGDLGGVHTGGLMDSRYGNLANVAAGCTIDGMAASCSTAMTALNSGAGEECPDGECSRYNPNLRNGQGGIENFRAYADGNSGYQPQGSRYLGNGLVIAPYAVRPNSDPNDEFAGMVELQKPVPSGPPTPTPDKGDSRNPCNPNYYASDLARELKSIAKKVGGKYDPVTATITGLGRVQFQYVVKRFESAGFVQFHSYNPEHPGVNLERQVDNGPWYHVTIEPGRLYDPGDGSYERPHSIRREIDQTAPPRRITIHCDSAENHSLHHLWYDYFRMTWP